MDISCLNYIYMCNSSFAIPYIPKYFFTLLKQSFPSEKHRNPTGKQRNLVGKSGFRFYDFFEFLNFETEKSKIGPENTFRVAPETKFFPKNQIFRPEIFSLSVALYPFRCFCGRRAPWHPVYIGVSKMLVW